MMHALIDTCTSRPPLFYLLGREMALQLESLILHKITWETCFKIEFEIIHDCCVRVQQFVMWWIEMWLFFFVPCSSAEHVPEGNRLWLKAGFIIFSLFQIYTLGKTQFYNDWQDYQLARKFL